MDGQWSAQSESQRNRRTTVEGRLRDWHTHRTRCARISCLDRRSAILASDTCSLLESDAHTVHQLVTQSRTPHSVPARLLQLSSFRSPRLFVSLQNPSNYPSCDTHTHTRHLRKTRRSSSCAARISQFASTGNHCEYCSKASFTSDFLCPLLSFPPVITRG